MKSIYFRPFVADEMVRAILADRKTVMRRVVKPQPKGAHIALDCDENEHTFDLFCGNCGVGGVFADWAETIKAPFWPGDILYVRETWGDYSECRPGGAGYYLYRADYPDGVKTDTSWDGVVYNLPRWHPSIHMPCEAARIFLRVTNVYPQQLKDVAEVDAKAEGFGSRNGFMAAILKMYPDCTEESWFWVNEFERISREDAQP